MASPTHISHPFTSISFTHNTHGYTKIESISSTCMLMLSPFAGSMYGVKVAAKSTGVFAASSNRIAQNWAKARPNAKF